MRKSKIIIENFVRFVHFVRFAVPHLFSLARHIAKIVKARSELRQGCNGEKPEPEIVTKSTLLQLCYNFVYTVNPYKQRAYATL